MNKTSIIYSISLLLIGFGLIMAPNMASAWGYGGYSVNNSYLFTGYNNGSPWGYNGGSYDVPDYHYTNSYSYGGRLSSYTGLSYRPMPSYGYGYGEYSSSGYYGYSGNSYHGSNYGFGYGNGGCYYGC